ncbi:cupin domain-containing protein [Vibrio maerlii]|uniref:ribosomal protein uL16 3-hydroxylase n=1 Tax=Vibrio maerlii TaxID=2231648 RepID=UPI000E3EC12E|nr:cupin domain-containing protein [Vibrio maerlii]
MYQLSFSLEEFLAEYWQKKPTIIKGGFANFQDPISPEEIAGLSMEEEVDSRFVSNLNDEWSAEHGPFPEEKFAQLPETHWQLIVQAANHWHQGAAEMLEPFKAMPNWLFDDLMVLYSVEGGGVGPHIDQYDVFIVQGQGKRYWRVGEKDHGQYNENHRHTALRQIESFDTLIEGELEPGDILYIPPGFPHEGKTLEPSMSYSVGYRSPKEQELLSNFADYVLAHEQGDMHLHNPELNTRRNHSEVSNNDIADLTKMLKAAMASQDNVNQFLGCMLSQSRHQLDIVAPEEVWQAEELVDFLQSGKSLYKVSGLKSLFLEDKPNIAYINGEIFEFDSEETHIVTTLCNYDEISAEDFTQISHESLIHLTALLNKGYWFVAD